MKKTVKKEVKKVKREVWDKKVDDMVNQLKKDVKKNGNGMIYIATSQGDEMKAFMSNQYLDIRKSVYGFLKGTSKKYERETIEAITKYMLSLE